MWFKQDTIHSGILEYSILELDFGEDYLEGAPRKTRVKVGKLDQLKWANAFGGGRAALTGQNAQLHYECRGIIAVHCIVSNGKEKLEES